MAGGQTHEDQGKTKGNLRSEKNQTNMEAIQQENSEKADMYHGTFADSCGTPKELISQCNNQKCLDSGS